MDVINNRGTKYTFSYEIIKLYRRVFNKLFNETNPIPFVTMRNSGAKKLGKRGS